MAGLGRNPDRPGHTWDLRRDGRTHRPPPAGHRGRGSTLVGAIRVAGSSNRRSLSKRDRPSAPGPARGRASPATTRSFQCHQKSRGVCIRGRPTDVGDGRWSVRQHDHRGRGRLETPPRRDPAGRDDAAQPGLLPQHRRRVCRAPATLRNVPGAALCVVGS